MTNPPQCAPKGQAIKAGPFGGWPLARAELLMGSVRALNVNLEG